MLADRMRIRSGKKDGFPPHIYKDGIEYLELFNSYSSHPVNTFFNKYSNYISFGDTYTSPSYVRNLISTRDRISTIGFNTLCVDFKTFVNGWNAGVMFGLSNTSDIRLDLETPPHLIIDKTSNIRTTIEINISAITYDLYFVMQSISSGTSVEVQVYNIWLE